jgi:diphosphomevalonate decarboxylase
MNASVSMTLDGLCTWLEIEREPSVNIEVRWLPEGPAGAPGEPPILSEAGIGRFVRHFERVLTLLPEVLPGLHAQPGRYAIRAANTFPTASGIASSASSFAALTLAAACAAADDPRCARSLCAQPAVRRGLARIARQGSGSSCRSFEGPWVLWDGADAAAVPSALPPLTDLVLVISSHPKAVSSSEAHARVRTSPLWEGRVERANARAFSLAAALSGGDLSEASRIAWSEMWEMHSLFHTASQPFSYWHPGTLEALQWLEPRMTGPAAPIVTLDAGPNVHLLVPTMDAPHWRARLKERFPDFAVLQDQAGAGAAIVDVS